MGAPLARFRALWGEIADLGSAAGLLAWDQETYMPRAGEGARGQVQATLAGLRHARLLAPELSEIVARLAAESEPGSAEAALAREADRILTRVKRLPERLVREQAEAAAAGHGAWVAARSARSFALFRPALERLVALAREEADLLAATGQERYEALLEEHEPGARAEELGQLLSEVCAALAPLLADVAERGVHPDAALVMGAWPREKQLAFARECAERIGFDFTRGRLDPAPHPFCTGLARDDVRLTWRWVEADFRPALFGVLHEAGHGLYEQGLPAEWARTPLGEPASLGVHESQSRLWENLVARSPGFWRWAMPRLQAAFPAARDLTVERLLPLLHTARPSLNRVEADPNTYDLHVAIRFELERALFAGRLAVGDLPEAWSAAYGRLLGIRPRDEAEGVLQDVHWSMGAFGYFPTYSLGNLIAAQLFAAAERELGAQEEPFARGEFAPLLDWLRRRVHGLGRRLPMAELVREASGRPLGTADYLAQRRASLALCYG